MIKKIEHIGIAVNSVDEAIKVYKDALGLKVVGTRDIPESKMKIAFLQIGDSQIELLESSDPESAIGKHLLKRGEGLHHIALEVTDIEGTIATLQKKGIEAIDKTPRKGAGHARIAFMQPKATKALIELVEKG